MKAWIARNLLYRPAASLRGEGVFRLLQRYEESQWWSPERIALHQERALGELLRRAAAETPFYGAAFRAAGLTRARIGPEHLARLPIVRKAELVERAADLQSRAWRGATSWKTTGGSTGVAVRVRKNRGATAAEQAASWRSYAWYGVEPGHRQARFWGVPTQARARVRSRAIDAVMQRDRFSAFAFRRQDLHAYFERIYKQRPDWVYGYASMLSEFAAFCLEENLPLGELGIRAVVTTSEVMSPSDRERTRRGFGAPVFNEYGCGEFGAIMYECERGLLHLMAENLHVETIPDPTPDEPRACSLVVTDLHNRAMPLIRYDVGDRAVPASAPCACGRGLPGFERVFGRAYDFVETSDGTRYHGEFFLYALEEARNRKLGIRQAQFVQCSPDTIAIRVVPDLDYERGAAAWLCEQLKQRSGGRLHAYVTEVQQIPRERSGKIRLIIGLGQPSAGAPAN